MAILIRTNDFNDVLWITFVIFAVNGKISDKGKYSNDARPGYCKCDCRQCRRESAASSRSHRTDGGGETQARAHKPTVTTTNEQSAPPPPRPPPSNQRQRETRTTTARVTTVDAERPGKASKLFTLLALPFPDQNVGRRYLDDPNCRKWAGYFSQQNDEQPRAC